MKSGKFLATTAMAAVFIALAAAQPALAYDDVRRIPRPIITNAPKPTEAASYAAMQRNIERRCNDASGGGATITQDQAVRAGWGWVSDNFSKIDRQGDGGRQALRKKKTNYLQREVM